MDVVFGRPDADGAWGFHCLSEDRRRART